MTDASAREVGDRPDLRLVPSAAATWLATLAVAPWAGGRWVLAAATLAMVVAVGLLARGGRGGLVAGAALAAAAAVSVGLFLRVAAVGSPQLRGLSDERAVAVVELVVLTDPRPLPPRSGGFGATTDQVVLDARLEVITARGRTWRTRVPVVVLAPARGWGSLLPSQRAEADVRLAPPRQGDTVAALVVARRAPTAVGPPSRLQRVAGILRHGLRDAVSGLPEGERGLLPGLVVGDTSGMPDGLTDDFRAAGLTHLVAVSGSNVGIVLAATLLAARWAGLRARAVPATGLLAVLGFLVLARPEPSVLRATVCGVVAVVALARGGRSAGIPALCTAIVVLLLLDPWLGRSYGFALSVLATAGLLVLAPGWRVALARRLPPSIADAVAVPAAAQVVCAPVIVLLSSNVSVVAIPANLLAAPAVAPATVLGVIIALVAPVAPPLAQALTWLAWAPTAWIVGVAQVSAGLPGATVGWPAGTAGAVLLAGLVLVGWLAGPWARRHPAATTMVLLLLALQLSPWGPHRPWPPRDVRAVFCDVGQGDAVVLPTTPRHAVLVDAGPVPDAVDRCLDDLGIRALDAVLLTHFHADHVEGLPGALAGRSVGELVVGPLDEPPEEVDRVLGWAQQSGVPVRRVVVGEQRQVGPLRWQVLWPSRPIRGEGSDPNNASIVLLADSGGVRLLLTGDVEAAAQSALVPAVDGLDPPVDVMKVPHHGSRSQDPRLVTTVRPRLAVVSVGEGNTYGHPAAETLAAYAAAGVPVLRTDRSGDIAVVGSGGSLRLVARHE